MKKIAVFHSFVDNIGGAEIVSLTLARELNADLYSTNIDLDKIKKMGFADVIPRIFSIGKVPVMAPFRQQITLWKFRRLNLGKKYDHYIISGDWAMSGAVNNTPNIWYAHAPLNEIWEFKDYVRENQMKAYKRPLFDLWVYANRKLSLKYSKYVGKWVCNSSNTRARILKYYNKEAEVIFPPIYTGEYLYKTASDYWISINRLVFHKKIEIQMDAFRKLPNEKLIIVGSYEKKADQFETYKNYIESIKPENVEILSWINKDEIINLLSSAKGLITTSYNEDFGMTAVEAMASGKLVIAPNEGGYKESVIDNKTGFLIDDMNSNSLSEKIVELSKGLADSKLQDFYKDNCQKQANNFDTYVFINSINNLMK